MVANPTRRGQLDRVVKKKKKKKCPIAPENLFSRNGSGRPAPRRPSRPASARLFSTLKSSQVIGQVIDQVIDQVKLNLISIVRQSCFSKVKKRKAPRVK